MPCIEAATVWPILFVPELVRLFFESRMPVYDDYIPENGHGTLISLLLVTELVLLCFCRLFLDWVGYLFCGEAEDKSGSGIAVNLVACW